MQISEAVEKDIKAQLALHEKDHARMVLGRAPKGLVDKHSAMYVAPYRLALNSVNDIGRELGLTKAVELMNGPPGPHVRAIVLECRDSEGNRVVLKIGEPATQCKANALWSADGVPVPRVIAFGTEPRPIS